MERVSTVGYYVTKQCPIDFITERGEFWCSICSETMLNCSADKSLEAIPIRGVSVTPPGWSSITLASAVDWNTACKLQSRRRHAMATKGAQPIQNTCTASNEKALRETQTLRAGCSNAEPKKNFAPTQTPFRRRRTAKI